MNTKQITVLSIITIIYIIITWTPKHKELAKWIKIIMGSAGIIIALWAIGARILVDLGIETIKRFIK